MDAHDVVQSVNVPNPNNTSPNLPQPLLSTTTTMSTFLRLRAPRVLPRLLPLTTTRTIGTFGYTQSKSLIYTDYGAPPSVLSLHSHSISPAAGTDILIRFLASPINPADINQIEGVYPSKPPLTTALGTALPAAVPGNEAVVEVISTGASVPKDVFKPGDRAIMARTAFGTWRTHAMTDASALQRIDEKFAGITNIQAATVAVNPCTAYRMLKDFVPLEQGGWFIQNGANSGVGRAAMQLARKWGWRSVNVVRGREGFEELEAELKGLGADLVVKEEELGRELKQRIKGLTGGKGIRLGFNCVGGKATTNLIRQLG